MKLIFVLSLALLATLVYADPFEQVEDFDEVEAFTEDEPAQLDEAINDDDDDKETEDDAEDFDGHNKRYIPISLAKMKPQNCSRTLRKEIGKCLKINCRLEQVIKMCLEKGVVMACQPDEDTKNCILIDLPACLKKFCKPGDRKLRKPGRKCMRKFRKCVKKAEGSGMELEL